MMDGYLASRIHTAFVFRQRKLYSGCFERIIFFCSSAILKVWNRPQLPQLSWIFSACTVNA
jgi:hypothetical protein